MFWTSVAVILNVNRCVQNQKVQCFGVLDGQIASESAKNHFFYTSGSASEVGIVFEPHLP